MRKLEIGDRVSFINEKQDGIITKILQNGNYLVEIEDGFEIEVTAAELVKIISSDKKLIPSSDKSEGNKEEKPFQKIELRKSLQGLNDAIALVLMPTDSTKVLTGSVSYFLVNESTFDVLYTFSYKVNHTWYGISSGKLNSLNEVFVGELTRDILMETESLQLQLVFHRIGFFHQNPVFTKEISVEYPDLNNVNKNLKGAISFSKTNTLISFAEAPRENLDELLKKYQTDKTISTQPSSHSLINEKKIQADYGSLAPGFMEKDLHIGELVEDFSGLSNAEILEIQLKHFQKFIDEALIRKAQKITFIHGVGNGKLKSAIRSELSKIPGLTYRDGPYEKYGAGATEVFLR